MKKNFIEEMKKEALRRIETLTKEFELRPNIYKYFEEGKIYYSYLIAGISGCIDTIHYDERYANVVAEFENKYGMLVYHVVETGNTISLLFVSDIEDDWDSERLFAGQYLLSYVYNFDYPDCSEFGDIVVGGLDGALVRIA